MAVTRLRLALSLSAVKRFIGDGGVVDHLLTQASDFLVVQDGRLLLGENSEFATGPRFVDEPLSALLTEAGELLLMQDENILSAQRVLSVEETGENFLLSQDNKILISESGLRLLVKQSQLVGQSLPADGLTTQDGISLFTQDGLEILAEQSEFTGLNIEGDILLLQNGKILTAENHDYLNAQSSVFV